jgi:hypothetical protein
MSRGRFIVVELVVWPRLVMCIVCVALTRIELKIPPPNWTAAVILMVVAFFFLVSAGRVAWLKWGAVLWP